MAFIKFLKPKNQLEEGGRTGAPIQQDEGEPEKTCPNCHKSIAISRLWANKLVCSCGYHFRMKARWRINMITDKGTFCELYTDMKSGNPLQFPGYKDKLDTVRTASNEEEAVICGTAEIGKQKCCIFAMESHFMMGSMGSVVGEKITCLFEYATKHHLPVIGFTVSGGARMQEGLLSLMQMAKTSAAVKNHSDAGLLYIAVLTDPTTGGVTASFAMEADIIMAEPGATVGFAGARVIEQTTKKALPKEFQKSEFVLEHGFIDCIVERNRQKNLLTEVLKMHNGGHTDESDTL
ncbi:MAG: acetyl-CoA carboxylase, carboxyltransferase subunit beta [Eubacterium sp.]